MRSAAGGLEELPDKTILTHIANPNSRGGEPALVGSAIDRPSRSTRTLVITGSRTSRGPVGEAAPVAGGAAFIAQNKPIGSTP
jgi:hypothetical protein